MKCTCDVYTRWQPITSASCFGPNLKLLRRLGFDAWSACSRFVLRVKMEIVENESTLNHRSMRFVYLITCSQVQLEIAPTRQAFSDIVVEAFENSDPGAKPVHWVCSQEEHQNGGIHYHMAVKLSRRRRWKKVRWRQVRPHCQPGTEDIRRGH